MRILLTTDPIGGVWTFTQELSEQLVGRGHHIHLLSFGRSLSPIQTKWCQSLERSAGGAFSCQSSEVPLEWMQENDRVWPEGEAIVAAAIGSFAPDLLHANQFCFGALAGTLPRIVTAHSDVLSWAEACRPAGLEESEWLQTYRSLVGEGLARATAVTAPTHWMADALAQRWQLPSKVHVIANGRTLIAQKEPGKRKMQALSAGRLWDEAKGTDVLLARDWPMPVLLAGEESFEGSRVVSEAESVRSLGTLSEQDLFALMNESAIYIATSRYEPFGLAPLEAALHGCALVMRDIGPFRELWGNCALYFSGAPELAGTLERLANDPELLSAMGEAARRKAQQFTADAMAESYLQLYAEALGHTDRTSHRAGWERDAA